MIATCGVPTGDETNVMPFFDPEVEWTPVEEGASLRGHEAVLRWWIERWMEPWEQYHFEVSELIDAGDEVIADTCHRAKAKASGVQTDWRLFMLFTLRDGKIARYRGFLDRAEALKAAGLEE